MSNIWVVIDIDGNVLKAFKHNRTAKLYAEIININCIIKEVEYDTKLFLGTNKKKKLT